MEQPYESFIITKEGDSYSVTTELAETAQIFWSASADGFSDDHPLGEFVGSCCFPDPAYGRRIYFHIFCGGRYYVAAPRSIEAGGMLNLRDLGGYETADGTAEVRFGQIFRSDMLCLCGEENMESLERLRIKRVLDFRSNFDVTTEGGRYADPPLRGASYELLHVYDENDERLSFTFESVVENRDSLKTAYETIFKTYKTSVFNSNAYKKLFRYLVDEKTPLLFHCYAGKDRTGMAAALILLALGVPRETIVYDYMLTAKTRRPFFGKRFEQYGHLIVDEETEKWFTFFTLVTPEAIEATLFAINEKYPDTEEFFFRELDMKRDDMEKLRGLYLVKH